MISKLETGPKSQSKNKSKNEVHQSALIRTTAAPSSPRCHSYPHSYLGLACQHRDPRGPRPERLKRPRTRSARLPQDASQHRVRCHHTPRRIALVGTASIWFSSECPHVPKFRTASVTIRGTTPPRLPNSDLMPPFRQPPWSNWFKLGFLPRTGGLR